MVIKSRKLIALLLCALLSAAALARATDDAKLLLGVWIPVKWTFGGSTTPPPSMSKMKLTLTAGRYEFLEGPSRDAGRLTLRAGKKPKEMDIVGVEGPNAGKRIPAIYRLQNGRLTICYGLDGRRPTSFSSPAKSMVLLVVFSRSASRKP